MTPTFDGLGPLLLTLALMAGPESQTPGGSAPVQKANASAPRREEWRRHGLTFNKGSTRIALRGYAQGDLREPDWTVRGDETGTLQAPDHELTRLRLGVEAKFGDVLFEFVMDPRNSQRGSRLKDATLGYRFSKKLILLAGHFKPPVSLEYLNSVSKTDFPDRSMLAERLAPSRDWGFGVSGDLKRIVYSVALLAGDDSAGRGVGASTAARLSVVAAKDLEVSGSFMQGRVTADPRTGTSEPSPKGASGATASGFTFWKRPHVQGMRRRLGADVLYVRDRLRFQGEYLESREGREGQGSTGQDIPDVRGRGWSAQAGLVLFGERKSRTVQPRTSVFSGGPGALEVVARAEGLKFDDTGDPAGFAGLGNRSRNIAPSGATALQAGLNYWFSRFLKAQGSALWESYNDPVIAPTPGKRGRYFTVVARVQIMIP